MKALLLAQWSWHGPARIPKILKQAGCEVAMVCKRGEWASMTRYADRFFYMDSAEERTILDAFDKALRTWRPDVVMPGSDNMVRTVMKYRSAVLNGSIELDEEMREVLRRSLPDPDKEHYLRGKLNFLAGLREKGVQPPPEHELVTYGDAEAFVEEHGYPVVVKPDEGFAGMGVTICKTEEELLDQLKQVLITGQRKRCAIQKYLGNKTATLHFAALEGRLLASNCIRRLRTHPGEMGPTSVARVVDSPRMREVAAAACEMVGYNGLGSVQFVVEDELCLTAYPLEFNARFSPFMHLGSVMGTNLPEVMVKAWQGLPFEEGKIQEGLTIALYPHEVLRDRNSEFLNGLVDNADDDPALAEEYQRLIDKRWSKSPSAEPEGQAAR